MGSPFTDDGSPSTAIKLHANMKMCHTLKFISFINKNNDVPFIVKKKVFDAALMSSILYGSESWINGAVKPIEKQYRWCVKQLLGVRKTTNNDVCMVELGMPSVSSLVKAKQRKFLKKMWQERNTMNDDPLIHAIKMATQYNDVVSRYISDLIFHDNDDIGSGLDELKTSVRNSTSNRLSFYKLVNSELKVHDIYLKRIKVNEIERMSWTKLRLSAHSLAVETGRWKKRGRERLPIEERLCQCGEVQTERHIIEDCPISQQIRDENNITTANELFERIDHSQVCNIIHKYLILY